MTVAWMRKIIAQVRPEEIDAALRDKIAIVEQKIGV